MFDFIAVPMGQVLKLLYDTAAFQNYGIAVILFTLFIKTLMLPFAIRQHRSTMQMRTLQPQLIQLQEKYRSDPEKLNSKIAHLYKENKTSPVGGYFPLLIQMPILFSLYSVFSRPLTFMYGLPGNTIDTIFQSLPEAYQHMSQMKDMGILSFYSDNPEALTNIIGLLPGNGMPNMQFLGLNLGTVPSQVFSSGAFPSADLNGYVLLLIPIFAFITALISTKVSGQTMAGTGGNAAAKNGTAQMMTMISPVMSGIFTITMPAGLGLYWIIANIIQIAQDLFLRKIMRRDE